MNTGRISRCAGSQQGFTLMEVLVAMNLAFIVLTLLVAVYLLMYRLIFSTVKKIENRQTLNSIMHRVDESLRRQQSGTITTGSGGEVLLLLTPADTVAFLPHVISYSGYLRTDTLESVAVWIQPRDEELLELTAIGTQKADRVVPRKFSYSTAELKFIKVQTWCRGKEDLAVFYPTYTSSGRFVNK